MHAHDTGLLVVDPAADAAYLYLTGVCEVERTVQFNTDINVDVNAEGAAVGVELLNLSAVVPVDALCEQFGLTAEELAPLAQLPHA